MNHLRRKKEGDTEIIDLIQNNKVFKNVATIEESILQKDLKFAVAPECIYDKQYRSHRVSKHKTPCSG